VIAASGHTTSMPLPTPAELAGPMTPVDSAWVRMDEPFNLMMVTGVLWFEGPVDRDRFEAMLRERLLVRFPRFATKSVHDGPGRPRWEAADVDFDYHLQETAVAHGDQAELSELVSRLMSTPLDYDRPPWQFHLVAGYRGGSALVARLHHSLADGIALARVLMSLSDDDVPGDAHDDLSARYRDEPGDSRPLPATLRRAAKNVGIAVAATGTLARISALPGDSAGIFRGELGTPKRAAWGLPLTLAEAKELASAAGGTVNDVLMTVVAGAMRRYAADRGRSPADLRVFVPVDLRLGAPVPPSLGNRFGLYVMPMPVGVADPGARLRSVMRGFSTKKAGREAVATFAILGMLGVVPQAVQTLAVRFLATKGSAVVTNLPGPRERIRMAGVTVAGVVPWVPQAARVGIGISVFSYAGDICIGVAGDAAIVPDPESVLEAFTAELEVLRRELLGAEPLVGADA
jgi:diacylglycerol O-acyltransferase / wax synthase